MADRAPLEERGPVINHDKAHGPYPEHADVIAGGKGIANKIRVGTQGEIISNELRIGNRFLK